MTIDPTATANNIIGRVKNLLLTPSAEWDRIASETPSTNALLLAYVAPLAAVAAIASFVGVMLLTGFAGFGAGILMGLVGIVVNVIITMVVVFLMSLLINALAPTFGSEPNAGRALQVAAHYPTAVWVASIALIVPLLGGFVVLIGALFSLYLFYLGLPKLMKTPADKQLPYFLSIIGICFAIGLVLTFTLRGMLFAGAYGLH